MAETDVKLVATTTAGLIMDSRIRTTVPVKPLLVLEWLDLDQVRSRNAQTNRRTDRQTDFEGVTWYI